MKQPKSLWFDVSTTSQPKHKRTYSKLRYNWFAFKDYFSHTFPLYERSQSPKSKIERLKSCCQKRSDRIAGSRNLVQIAIFPGYNALKIPLSYSTLYKIVIIWQQLISSMVSPLCDSVIAHLMISAVYNMLNKLMDSVTKVTLYYSSLFSMSKGKTCYCMEEFWLRLK